MFAALNSLKELVFPDICIGCSSPNSKFCFNCQLNWKSPVKKSYVGSNPLYFKSNYGTEAASIIFAVKDMKINSLISIVTVPSSKSSIRRRGSDHINFLALEVVKKIASRNLAVEYLPILIAKKNIKDQSKLNGRQRSENTMGNFGVIGCEFPQGAIFLIDDLVTTGSSMLEAVRALSEAKMTVTALVSACAVGRNSLIP